MKTDQTYLNRVEDRATDIEERLHSLTEPADLTMTILALNLIAGRLIVRSLKSQGKLTPDHTFRTASTCMQVTFNHISELMNRVGADP